MKKFYPESFTFNFFIDTKLLIICVLRYRNKNLIPSGIIACLVLAFAPSNSFSQKIELSYSYFNTTRNTGGGNLEHGDTIEIHALAKVNATINNLYYIDTIPTGTQFVSGSLKLMTNEGLSFIGSGPYTDATNDDAGVYNTSANAVRINIPGNGTGFTYARNGANFGLATGGGTVVNGSTLPKFYGNTLFIVAYKLLVTAANGDTIHPTGNYYFDTSGVTKSYTFNYAGIKVIQNQALCTNFSSATFTAESSFGSGSIQNRALGVNAPGYQKKTLDVNNPGDNYYSVVNNTSANGTTNNAGPYKPTTNNARVFGGFWDIIGDHTGAANTATGNAPVVAGQPGGYMLVVNAAFTTGEVYRDTIKSVCPNTYYEFSAWVRNICGVCGIDKNSTATYTPGVLPNLSYTINDIDYYTTGNMQYNTTWEKRGFIYKTGPSETQFRITIKNNAAGGGGNDWVLDDIKLATCYPNLVNSPKDTATSCSGAYLSLSDTVKSFFNNYTNFCWEKSLDGINWISTGVCGTKTTSIVNGLYQYVVDTTFKTVKADSGTYYRLKVGTTFSNLNDPNCSVGNSQKIFVKVFNVNCTLLNTKLLTFSGSLANNQTLLRWASQNKGNVHYEIEKSFDGIKFYKAGAVAGVDDANEVSYSFIDPGPVGSIAYYRLKLINSLNSESKYSKIIVLYNKNASFKISLVNPFTTNIKGDIFLPEDGEATFTLYDVFGKAVGRKSIRLSKGVSLFTIDDVQRLSSGIYILSTQFSNKIIQNKLFKIN